MKIVGLTGGIGSGKSTVLKWLESKGIPCFESDRVGRVLLDQELKQAVISRFGDAMYSKGTLDRGKLASLVFNNPNALEDLNQIVHPAVQQAFEEFKQYNLTAPILVKEAAILFESGAYQYCDLVVLVCAPKEDRIQRVMKRDGVRREEVLKRMALQWEDAKKKPLSDFILNNTDRATLEKQLEDLFVWLSQSSKKD